MPESHKGTIDAIPTISVTNSSTCGVGHLTVQLFQLQNDTVMFYGY